MPGDVEELRETQHCRAHIQRHGRLAIECDFRLPNDWSNDREGRQDESPAAIEGSIDLVAKNRPVVASAKIVDGWNRATRFETIPHRRLIVSGSRIERFGMPVRGFRQ